MKHKYPTMTLIGALTFETASHLGGQPHTPEDHPDTRGGREVRPVATNTANTQTFLTDVRGFRGPVTFS